VEAGIKFAAGGAYLRGERTAGKKWITAPNPDIKKKYVKKTERGLQIPKHKCVDPRRKTRGRQL